MSLHIEQSSRYVDPDWWHWAVWLDGSEAALDAVRKVTYVLHHTFPNPVRDVTDRSSNFRLGSAGWGMFTVFAKVHRQDGTVLKLEHELQLAYPDGRLTQA